MACQQLYGHKPAETGCWDRVVHVRQGVALRILMLVPLGGLLAACESSSRLGSLLPGEPYRPARNEIAAAPPPLTPAPAGEVESSALPPPPGANVATAPPPVAPGEPFPPATGTINPPQTPPQGPVPGANPANRVATAPVAPTVNAAPSAPTRTGLIGNWSMRESNGASCRVTLSSAPKLDLYGAGTSGCQNRELQRINAWELAGSDVILYEPGGGVVARLRQAGQQNFSGATAKSGAPLTMSK